MPTMVSILSYIISLAKRTKVEYNYKRFQSKQWLPNCIGAIDGNHIIIRAPNRKKLLFNPRIHTEIGLNPIHAHKFNN